MEPNPELESTLRRYILGELDETARLALEEQVITTSHVSDALALTEQALIDEYLDDALSGVERASFERRVNTIRPLRDKVRFARRLRARPAPGWAVTGESIHQGPGLTAAAVPTVTATIQPGADEARPRDHVERRTAGWAYHPAWAVASLAAALVLIVGGVGWWATDSARQGEIERLQAQHQQDRQDIDRLDARVGDLLSRVGAAGRERAKALRDTEAVAVTGAATPGASGAPRGTSLPTFVLATGLVRSGGSLPRVTIPEGAHVVRMRLPVVEGGLGEYRALLYDADGRELMTMSGLHASGAPPAVTVTVAAEWLPRGDYELQLLEAGGERAFSYPFRVTSR